MKNTIFTGAGVAIATPMLPDGSIHWEELGRMMETVEASLTEIARDMTGGVIHPKSDFKNSHGNCSHCRFRAVCRLLPREESENN